MSEPIVVGLLGITHPHASARVRALREIDNVEVVAAADDDSRLKYFTDEYDLERAPSMKFSMTSGSTRIMRPLQESRHGAHTVRALAAGRSVRGGEARWRHGGRSDSAR